MMKKFGFIVYIDALGTSEGQPDYEQRFSDFRSNIIDLYPSDIWQARGLTIRGLSDSVFFILHLCDNPPSNPKKDNEFYFEIVEDFFIRLKELQMRCLGINMPLRGGVTIGVTKVELIGTAVLNFIGGEAIVDAVNIERNLKMCGIAFAPKFMLDSQLHEIYDRYLAKLRHKNIIDTFDVPTSFGLVETHCVSWPEGLDYRAICARFSHFMPQHRFDQDGKDVSKASKYFAAGLFADHRCRAIGEEDRD